MTTKDRVEGRREISTGIYITGQPPHESLHIDIPRLLIHYDLADTEANRDMLIELGREACEAQGLICKATAIKYLHNHKCPRCKAVWQHEGERKACKLANKAMCHTCQS